LTLTCQCNIISKMKLLVCCLTLISLGVVSPAPKHYLIETEDAILLADLKLLGDAVDLAKMGNVVEKVSNDVMEAIEGEKTYGEIIEMGKEDLRLLGEAVDTDKMKEGMERVYQDVRRQVPRRQGDYDDYLDYGDYSLDFGKMMKMVQMGMGFLPKIQDFLNEHIPEDLKDIAKDKAKEFAPKIRDMKDKAMKVLPKLLASTDKAVEFLPKMWNFIKENAGEYLKVKPSETDGEEDKVSERTGEDYRSKIFPKSWEYCRNVYKICQSSPFLFTESFDCLRDYKICKSSFKY